MTQQIQQHPENQNTERTVSVVFVSASDQIPSAEDTEARQRRPDETDAETIDTIENLDEMEALLFEELLAEGESLPDEVNEEYPVSPFGFGPYPKIPAGFYDPNIFDRLAEMGASDMAKALELQKRVIIKLWEQSISLENIGISGESNGKVYIYYPDVVYVKWDYWTDDAGKTHKYAGVIRGHPNTVRTYQPYLDKGEIPPEITVWELPDGYLDAHDFLGLQ